MDYGIAVLSGVIDLVILGNDDAREVGATIESTFPNLRHRWGDGDARETGAIIERNVPNLRHRWGDSDALEAGATIKSTAPNLRHRWGDGDAREAGATTESIPPNLRHRWRDGDAREAGAIIESTLPNLRHRWWDDGIHTSSYQRITLRMDYGITILSGVIELIILGNGDAREAGATRESTVPNLRHRFWYGDAREVGATRESKAPNFRHRWGDDGIHTSSYQRIALRMDYGIAVLS